ncbi:MAG: dTDP-4-dehydrorhamnose 3,5-epimerase [Planctomycetes bacterium]|nr:dTDP-4-dehydrorhamnose 3,5-epimerase [Planctomycetota bacterium]
MRLNPTPLSGLFVVEIEPIADARGFFARTWCGQTFASQGLPASLAQCSVSVNPKRATLRGLHWQAAPHGETKIVRVTSGAIFDVAVDLRIDSPTFRLWFGVELTSSNRKSLCIGPGFAHGFITLAPDTEVLYMMDKPQHAGSARGARYNDAAFKIDWPLAPECLSERDANYPDFEVSHGL